MCYNTELKVSQEDLEFAYDAEFENEVEYEPAYRITAFSIPSMPVITADDPHTINMLKWGLIPFWIKSEDQASKIRMGTFNAKAETITEKPSFRSAVKTKRCLVPATSFYEWRDYNKKKYPYYISLRDERLFSFAGIYDTWTNKSTGEIHNTFSIITTAANPLMEKIHNTKKRMPVILPRETEKQWLASDVPLDQTLQLLQPYPEDEMQAHTISRLITSRQENPNQPQVSDPFVYDELPAL